MKSETEYKAEHREQERQIWAMTRDEVVRLLEGACIQCYDTEDDQTLKVALLENVQDGTISL